MSLREEFVEAGIEYAKRLTDQREAERLAALAIEARHETNAAAFAAAFTHALNGTEEQETTE